MTLCTVIYFVERQRISLFSFGKTFCYYFPSWFRHIPSSGSLILSANSSACARTESEVRRLEHVQVMMSLKHRHRGLLSIALISPSGTRSQLLTTRRNDHSTKGLKVILMYLRDFVSPRLQRLAAVKLVWNFFVLKDCSVTITWFYSIIKWTIIIIIITIINIYIALILEL